MDKRTEEFVRKSGCIPRSDTEVPVKYFIPPYIPAGLIPGSDITYVYNDDGRIIPDGVNHDTAIFETGRGGRNRVVSIRDETNSFTPYPPTMEIGGLQEFFNPIIKNRHLTIVKVRALNFGLYGDRQGYAGEEYRRDFINSMIRKEEAISKFEVKESTEQKARIEALKQLHDMQGVSGVQSSCYAVYIQIDLDKLTEGIGNYIESFNLLVRVEQLTPRGRSQIDFTCENGFLYAHPWSETDDFETLYQRVDNVKGKYLTTKFKIVSSDNRYVNTVAFSVQYDKISQIPIKMPDNGEAEGIYFYRHEPEAPEGERETIRLVNIEEAASLGIFFNFHEATGHQQTMQSKRTIDEDTKRISESAERVRQAEQLLRQRDQELRESEQRYREAELKRKAEDADRAIREAEAARLESERRRRDDRERAERDATAAKEEATRRRQYEENTRTLETERKAREDEIKRKIEVLRLSVQTVGAIGAIAAAAVALSKLIPRGTAISALAGLSWFSW